MPPCTDMAHLVEQYLSDLLWGETSPEANQAAFVQTNPLEWANHFFGKGGPVAWEFPPEELPIKVGIEFLQGHCLSPPPQPSPSPPRLPLKLQKQVLVLHIRRHGHHHRVAILH